MRKPTDASLRAFSRCPQSPLLEVIDERSASPENTDLALEHLLSNVLDNDDEEMSFVSLSSSCKCASQQAPSLTRSVSSSPYGRTHVWRRRAPKLPNPVVPHFPQRVVLSDGSTYIHWTTSPRSTIKLTRDTRNAPIWAPWLAGSNPEDIEGASAGRLGRFRRRFEDLGESANEMEMGEWNEMAGASKEYVVRYRVA